MRCPSCHEETIFSAHHSYTACLMCGEKFIFNPLAIGELWYSLTIIAAMQAVFNQVNKRYWVSWWTPDERLDTETPFQYWITGSRGNSISICAVITSANKWNIEQQVKKLFPDIEWRFIEEKDADWTPGERFPAYENRTSLYD